MPQAGPILSGPVTRVGFRRNRGNTLIRNYFFFRQLTALLRPATIAATPIMRRASLSRIIRLILGAILLNAVVCLQAAPAALAHSLPVPSASLESAVDRDEIFLRETFSVSREFGLQCARQSRRVLTSTRSADGYAPGREKALRLHTTETRAFYPAEGFFPRKVAPPDNENDPFLK